MGSWCQWGINIPVRSSPWTPPSQETADLEALEDWQLEALEDWQLEALEDWQLDGAVVSKGVNILVRLGAWRSQSYTSMILCI